MSQAPLDGGALIGFHRQSPSALRALGHTWYRAGGALAEKRGSDQSIFSCHTFYGEGKYNASLDFSVAINKVILNLIYVIINSG